MRLTPVHDYAHLAPAELASVESTVCNLRTLADVLRWARTSTPVRRIAEIVTQDEYTHDVVVEAPGQPYLAFDTT